MFPPCSEAKSAWYKHNSPGVDNSGSNSSSVGCRFGADPVSIVNVALEFSSHGIFAATCPVAIASGVLSYRCMKLPPGIV
jgi:hypothetical protein